MSCIQKVFTPPEGSCIDYVYMMNASDLKIKDGKVSIKRKYGKFTRPAVKMYPEGRAILVGDKFIKPQNMTEITEVRLSHIKEILSLANKTQSGLRKLNPEHAYNGEELTREQLVYQIVFLRDAPTK